MLFIGRLPSFCAALFVLLGPAQAELDNTTSPTSVFQSVSHRKFYVTEPV